MMFGSDLLGVAVGLIVLYLLLSVLASATNEILESLLKYRSRYLTQALREMLSDPDGTTAVQALFQHPLIGSLFRGAYDPHKRSNLPSYIPAQTFAAALLDIARGDVSAADLQPPAPARLGLVDIPTSSRSVPQLIDDGPSASAAPPRTPAPDAIAALRASVASSDQLGDGPKRALLALVDGANGDADAAMRRIEDWYDNSMERVTGWYKRHAQWMLFALGLAIATLFNADTVALFKSLASDPAERAMLLDVAREYAKAPPGGAGKANQAQPADGQIASQTSSTSSPLVVGNEHATPAAQQGPGPSKSADGVSPSPSASVGAVACSKTAETPECRIADDVRQVRQLNLPLGWEQDDPRTVLPESWRGWTWKIVGILITAIAITVGAPFWFDMLNKVMIARAALKPDTASKR